MIRSYKVQPSDVKPSFKLTQVRIAHSNLNDKSLKVSQKKSDWRELVLSQLNRLSEEHQLMEAFL